MSHCLLNSLLITAELRYRSSRTDENTSAFIKDQWTSRRASQCNQRVLISPYLFISLRQTIHPTKGERKLTLSNYDSELPYKRSEKEKKSQKSKNINSLLTEISSSFRRKWLPPNQRWLPRFQTQGWHCEMAPPLTDWHQQIHSKWCFFTGCTLYFYNI